MREKLVPMLKVKDVATRYQVHENTILRWIAEERLPAVRVGRLLRIRPEDLERFEQDWAE